MNALRTASHITPLPTSSWIQKCLRLEGPGCHKRFIDPFSGIRFYPVQVPGQDYWIALPGVTSILGSLTPPEETAFLDQWREREIAAGRDPNAGRDRGTRVHARLEAYIRGLPPPEPAGELELSLAPSDQDFFSGMEKHLDHYESFIWSEKPLVPGYDHCWSATPDDPDRLARVWSLLWGFSGTPDLIARRSNGMTILGDFKTSSKPYYRCSGNKIPTFKEVGFKKYKKTVRQLCGYKLAIKETLDIDIDALQIIVGLPEPGKAQMFYVHGIELEVEMENFKKAALAFWNNFSGCVQPDAIKQSAS